MRAVKLLLAFVQLSNAQIKILEPLNQKSGFYLLGEGQGAKVQIEGAEHAAALTPVQRTKIENLQLSIDFKERGKTVRISIKMEEGFVVSGKENFGVIISGTFRNLAIQRHNDTTEYYLDVGAIDEAIEVLNELSEKKNEQVLDPAQLERHRDSEDRFYGSPTTTNERLKELLRKADLTSSGKSLAQFALVGVKAQFLVEIEGQPYMLTMLSAVQDGKGSDFHLKKITMKEGKAYPVGDPIRIFEDATLWKNIEAELPAEEKK